MKEIIVSDDSSSENECSDEVRELPKPKGLDSQKVDSLLNSSEVHSVDEPSVIRRVTTEERR